MVIQKIKLCEWARLNFIQKQKEREIDIATGQMFWWSLRKKRIDANQTKYHSWTVYMQQRTYVNSWC